MDPHVAVREPEVWRTTSGWSETEYYDGRLLSGSEAVSLIDEMLRMSEFWCRLVTDQAEVHVAEGAIYLTLAGPELDDLLAGVAEQAGFSPYGIDRKHFNYLPPANERFWAGLRRYLGSCEQGILILRQWAAGFGGERWFWIASVDELDALQQDATPRVVYAVFRDPRLVRKKGIPNQQLSVAVEDESSPGDVRVFHDLSEAPLKAEHVADDQELAQLWESLGERGALFMWTEDAAVSYAARPDADGRVRVASSFQ